MKVLFVFSPSAIRDLRLTVSLSLRYILVILNNGVGLTFEIFFRIHLKCNMTGTAGTANTKNLAGAE